jgi:LPS export ABC transporter protein LptC
MTQAIVLTGLLVAIITMTGCRSGEAPRKAMPVPEKATPFVGQDVTFTITQQGKKSWILHAEHVTYSADQRMAELVTVKGQTFRPDGQPVAEFTAPAGQYDQVTKTITLHDGVTAKSLGNKPVVLNAPTLTWTSNAPMAKAKGGVLIQNPGFGKSTADTCEFSLDFNHIALQGNATSTVQ